MTGMHTENNLLDEGLAVVQLCLTISLYMYHSNLPGNNPFLFRASLKLYTSGCRWNFQCGCLVASVVSCVALLLGN